MKRNKWTQQKLVVTFGFEHSADTHRFPVSDWRTGVRLMVDYVENHGAGSWAMLTTAQNQFVANIFHNSTTGEVYCSGQYISDGPGHNVSLEHVKQVLARENSGRDSLGA